MKKIILLLIICLTLLTVKSVISQTKKEVNVNSNTALLIIDIQMFYFPDGALPLFKPESAAQNAQKLLFAFRKENKPVIHVKHIASSGSEIHELVAPIEGEKVILKSKANSFVNTDLYDYLKIQKIENIIICGMQTQMCVEAATRAASDYGFNCTVIEDACATRDLKYQDYTIKATDVHFSTLSALKGTYADIKTTDNYLNQTK